MFCRSATEHCGNATDEVVIAVSYKQKNYRPLVVGTAFGSMIISITDFFLPLCSGNVSLPYSSSDSSCVPVQKMIVAFILQLSADTELPYSSL